MVDDEPTDNPDENGSERQSDAPPVPTPPLWVYDGSGYDTWTHADTGLKLKLSKRYGKSGRYDDFVWKLIAFRDGVGEHLVWGGVHDRDVALAVIAKFIHHVPDGDYEPDPDGKHGVSAPPRWPNVVEGVEKASADPNVWLQ